MCPFPDHALIQVLDGEKVGPDDPLCSPNCPLQSVPVWFCGLSKPDSYGGAEDRLFDGESKVPKLSSGTPS